MFLCCFPSFWGSGRKKAQSERSFCCWRPWRKRHRRRLLPAGTKMPQNPNEDSVAELVDEFTYALSRYKGPVHKPRSSIPCWSEVGAGRTKDPDFAGNGYKDIIEKLFHGPDHIMYRVSVQVHQADSTVHERGKGGAELSLHSRAVCRMGALQGGMLEKVGSSMLPAFPARNIPHNSTFMSIHPAFSRAQQFLDQLFVGSWPPSIVHDAIKVFTMSGGLPPHNDQGNTPQDQVRKAIACSVGSWSNRCMRFGQPLLQPWFRMKQALVLVNSAALRQLGHPQLNLVNQEHLEAMQAMPQGSPSQLQFTAEPEEGSAQGPEPCPT